MPNDNTSQPNLNNDTRRAIGLAVQILEDMPEWLQPHSNMLDMRKLLDGETTGRDGSILIQSIATAIAYRTQQIIAGNPTTPDNHAVYANRMHEFTALFEIVQRIDAWTFAVQYMTICDTFARCRIEEQQS